MPASVIQPPTSAFARAIAGPPNQRVRRPSSSLIRASSRQRRTTCSACTV